MEGKRAVLVTTEFRGVFFGYVGGDDITCLSQLTLKNARNCIYWSENVKGVFGLAVTGPSPDCRIGPAVSELTLNKITSVSAVSDEAVARWEADPWRM